MTTDSVPDYSDVTDGNFTTESIVTPSIGFNESEFASAKLLREQILIRESVRNMTDVKILNGEITLSVFEAFILIEIVMTALEICIWIAAALKIKRWKNNYRNQMLIQLSVVRFLKRLIFLLVYLKEMKIISSSYELNTILTSCQFYIDFVIVFLVLFFAKHMYDCLIVVLVSISQNNLLKVSAFAWLLPVPITMACTAIITFKVLNVWTVSLLICCVIRWPLILVGTFLYLTILYRVIYDKIRKFARSLAVITFLLCLVINSYLFLKDIIDLWCSVSIPTVLTSYILGFFLNFLVLCLYVTLITLNFKRNINACEGLHKRNSMVAY